MKTLAVQHAEIKEAIAHEAVRGRTKRLRILQMRLTDLTHRILAKECGMRLRNQRRMS